MCDREKPNAQDLSSIQFIQIIGTVQERERTILYRQIQTRSK